MSIFVITISSQMIRFFSFTMLLFLASATFCQAKLTANTYTLGDAASPEAKIQQIAWLTGHWQGEGFGGIVREIWSPAQARQMVATFTMIMSDTVIFHEICMIAEENNTLVYKVKHFNNDLTGWEQKEEYVTFPLVKILPDAVYFRGLSMLYKNNHIDLYLALKNEDGSYTEEKLVYYPQKIFPRNSIPSTPNEKKIQDEINKHVWLPFIKAYATSDQSLYMSLHTKDLLRVNGGINGKVSSLKQYTIESSDHFSRLAKENKNVEIAFAFIERLSTIDAASERGIYRYTLIDGNRKTNYYGKFHVLLKKVNGKWKIAVDYDSDEDGSISEADFNHALRL